MAATPIDYLLASDTTSREIGRAAVVSVHEDGSVSVAGAGGEAVRCDVLLTAAGARLAPRPGEAVLVWHSGRPGERGVILGRIAAALSPLPDPDAVAHPPLASTLPVGRAEDDAREVPDAIVLEAKHSLTLRVGDGSITLRADGKVLIQGRDLVSSAQRLNRIKGGAVSVN